MSGMSRRDAMRGRWFRYEPVDAPLESSIDEGEPPEPDRSARTMAKNVTGLVAMCEFRPGSPSPTLARFTIREYVVASNGDMLLLRRLGWAEEVGGSGAADGQTLADTHTLADIANGVRLVAIPDDAADEDHPWQLLAALATKRGVEADVDALKRVPYDVYLSEAIVDWLEKAGA